MSKRNVLPPGGVPRVLRECRKVLVRNPGTTAEGIVAETLLRVLLGETKAAAFIINCQRIALREAVRGERA